MIPPPSDTMPMRSSTTVPTPVPVNGNGPPSPVCNAPTFAAGAFAPLLLTAAEPCAFVVTVVAGVAGGAVVAAGVPGNAPDAGLTAIVKRAAEHTLGSPLP